MRYFLSLLIPLSLHSSELTFTSNKVSYTGQKMQLAGDVHLSSPVGEITAEKAVLIKESGGSLTNIREGLLEDNVMLRFSDDSSLRCEKISMDIAQKMASVSSSNQPAVYLDQKHNLTLETKNVQLHWEERNENYTLKEMEASEGVTLSYGDSLKVFAKQASFQTLEDSNSSHEGTWKLYPENDISPCTVILNENALQAETITFNATNNQFTLSNVVGSMTNALGNTITFECSELYWSPDEDSLLLLGPSVLEGNNFGTLSCDQEIAIAMEDSKHPTSLVAQGNISLTHPEYVVECAGKMEFDPALDSLTASSSDKPITCRREYLEIIADFVKALPSNTEEPRAFEFKGHVVIRHPQFVAGAGFLTYAPDAGMLELKSLEDQKVCLSDRNEALVITADNLKIKREDEQVFEVLGGGHVKFAFQKEELDQIHKVMHSCLSNLF